MEPSLLLGLSNGDITNSCAYNVFESAICASVQIVHMSPHTSTTVVKTKKESHSYADTCVVNHHCLIVHDHNRQTNVYG